MNNIPKVVFSKTLTKAEWKESRIARGDLGEEIARLKSEPGKEIMAHGGARFVQALSRQDLIDEYRLVVCRLNNMVDCDGASHHRRGAATQRLAT